MKGLSPDTSERAQRHDGRWGNLNDPLREKEPWPQPLPASNQPMDRGETQHHRSRRATLWTTSQRKGLLPKEYGIHYEEGGKNIWGLYNTCCGMISKDRGRVVGGNAQGKTEG